MLLGMDEYPFHQFTNTFAAVAGSDPQWNDGHYVTCCDADGTVCLTSNVRLYQNNDVLDGFVCIRHEGKQYNVRLSRRLRPNMDHLGVGPLRIELPEPMRSLRMVLDENDVLGDPGISLDVLCRTTAGPHLDPIETTRIDGRLISERATYEVTGECSGWVCIGDSRVELTKASFFRNHSWGYQPGRGGARSGAPGGWPAPHARIASMGPVSHARSRRLLLRRPSPTCGRRQGSDHGRRPIDHGAIGGA